MSDLPTAEDMAAGRKAARAHGYAGRSEVNSVSFTAGFTVGIRKGRTEAAQRLADSTNVSVFADTVRRLLDEHDKERAAINALLWAEGSPLNWGPVDGGDNVRAVRWLIEELAAARAEANALRLDPWSNGEQRLAREVLGARTDETTVSAARRVVAQREDYMMDLGVKIGERDEARADLQTVGIEAGVVKAERDAARVELGAAVAEADRLRAKLRNVAERLGELDEFIDDEQAA